MESSKIFERKEKWNRAIIIALALVLLGNASVLLYGQDEENKLSAYPERVIAHYMTDMVPCKPLSP